MRIFTTGVEYAGTTTLQNAIVGWAEATLGPGKYSFDDHWKLPDIGEGKAVDENDLEMLANLTPVLKEMFNRYNIEYHHKKSSFFKRPDHQMGGWFIDHAVYGPQYYGYGYSGTPYDGVPLARRIENEIMEVTLDRVLVHVTATSEVVRNRKMEDPHRYNLVEDEDVDFLIDRFDEEFERSLLANKIRIDTSEATVEESLAEFVEQFLPMMTDLDNERMDAQEAKKRA